MTVKGNPTENDKMMNYNGVSWDGFPSLADLINSQAYSEGKWESDVNFLAFSKAVNELDLGNFADTKKTVSLESNRSKLELKFNII